MQEQEDQPHRAVTAGVPVSSAKPDGSAGIRCFDTPTRLKPSVP